MKPDKRYSLGAPALDPEYELSSNRHCGFSGNRFTEEYARLDDLIIDAYGVRRYQIVNAPDWADTGRDVFQIEAKAPGDVPLELCAACPSNRGY